MKRLRQLKIIFLLSMIPTISYAQDFIRLGLVHDFSKSKIVQNFSLDFNRTESIKEKAGKKILFSKNDIYILPTADVNIGDGVSSSENNVLTQLNLGRWFFGQRKSHNLNVNGWDKAIEFNPSYNSDKYFSEKLLFGQAKFLINFSSSKFNNTSENSEIKRVHSITAGPFSNTGYRYSRTFDMKKLYSTFGLVIEYKTRILKSITEDLLVFKLSGNYYYIVSDVEELTTDIFAGIIKSSIDGLIFRNIYSSLSHKYGNDNPNYEYIHTLELSIKVKY